MSGSTQETGRVLAIVHHDPSDVGTVAGLLDAAGYGLDIRCPLKGDALPAPGPGYSGTIVFGGAMSANDDHMDGIRATLDWLGKALDAGEPVVGICLGAQMIARVSGARVAPHEEGHWEIGYYPVNPVANGEAAFAPEGAHFYQWHGEGFDLPAGARLLASGATFPNQAFAIGRCVFGLQFHPEVTADLFTAWMDASPGFEERPNAQARAAHFAAAERHGDAVTAWLGGFLRQWLNDAPERR